DRWLEIKGPQTHFGYLDGVDLKFVDETRPDFVLYKCKDSLGHLTEPLEILGARTSSVLPFYVSERIDFKKPSKIS
ncbi:MAG: hypothetical protein NT055_00015, partial [Nitrospirae bacterium]|nr:hypothetical protein [Nitrospirota bacterium]